MTAQQARCFYHPDRVAVEKCEKCKRLICLQDKTIDRTYGGMDRADEIYIYCPVCYNEIKQGREKAGKVLGPVCIILFGGFCIISVAIMAFFLLNMFNFINSQGGFP